MSAVPGDDQPCDRERAVERVLQVVIDRIAAVIAGKLAVEQALEIAKRRVRAIERIVWPGLPEEIDDRTTHCLRRTHLYSVCDVVIAAPVLHLWKEKSAPRCAQLSGV